MSIFAALAGATFFFVLLVVGRPWYARYLQLDERCQRPPAVRALFLRRPHSDHQTPWPAMGLVDYLLIDYGCYFTPTHQLRGPR